MARLLFSRERAHRAAVVRSMAEHFAASSAGSDATGATGGVIEAVSILRAAWPQAPPELRAPLLELMHDALVCEEHSSSIWPHAVLAALLDVASPEELQSLGLRALQTVGDPGHKPAGDAALRAPPLPPRAVNAALLRLIPRQPLLCLDALAVMALREDFRSYFSTQNALLQFLVHCCLQPGAVSANAPAVAAAAPGGGGAGGSGNEAVAFQRSACRCLANLSPHPATREWIRKSLPLRSVLASAEDFTVRTYLGMALGVDGEQPLRA